MGVHLRPRRTGGGANPNGDRGRGSGSSPGFPRGRRGVQQVEEAPAVRSVVVAAPEAVGIATSSLLLPAATPASIPAARGEIEAGAGVGTNRGVRGRDGCAQFVWGWSPYIGSSCACREVTDDDHGSDATASCGHGRWWRPIHGVMACVTSVLARRAVV